MEKLTDAIGIVIFESKKFGGEKVIKGGCSPTLRANKTSSGVIEVMADVMICMEILKQVYGISDNEIQNYVCQKQNRCIERMKSDES